MTGVYLGIDTSNYTTSIALCDEKGKICQNLRRILSVPQGERGLRQSDAVFQHVKNLPDLFESLSLKGMVIKGIGCSTKPRPIVDSYMPVFKVGEGFAGVLSKTHALPLVSVSHQENHIRGAIYGAGLRVEDLDFPILATHFSGGTSELLIVSKTKDGFACELAGRSLDLNAGQLVDRVGVAMGLPFPAGKSLEDLALQAQKKEIRLSSRVEGTNFHFSGQENQAMALISKGVPNSEIALALFDAIAKTLERSVRLVAKKSQLKDILFAGGVMSNGIIKKKLEHRLKGSGLRLYFSDSAYTSDNAVGTALLTKERINGEQYG